MSDGVDEYKLGLHALVRGIVPFIGIYPEHHDLVANMRFKPVTGGRQEGTEDETARAFVAYLGRVQSPS